MHKRGLAHFDRLLMESIETPPTEYFSRWYAFYALLAAGEQVEPSAVRAGVNFCLDVEKGKPIADETLQWLAGGIKAHFESKKNIATFLGFKRKSRHEQERKKLHAGLRAFALHHILNEKYDNAVMAVVRDSGLGLSTVKGRYAYVKKQAQLIGWFKIYPHFLRR